MATFKIILFSLIILLVTDLINSKLMKIQYPILDEAEECLFSDDDCCNNQSNKCDVTRNSNSFECPSDDSNELVLLPSPESCGEYYICINGEGFSQKCLSGLHFNADKMQCDFPVNANCVLNDEVSYNLFYKI